MILSESSKGASAKNSKSLLSSSADRDNRPFINGVPTHNAALTGEVMLATFVRSFAQKMPILLNPFERLVRGIYSDYNDS